MTEDEKKLILFQIKEINEHMSDSDFQYDFFASLEENFLRRGRLSEKQIESLDKIYERVTR